MRIGVIFPQTEISADREAVREYAQAAEDLGYAHILAYDHVVGADTRTRPDWRGPYTLQTQFHEPFVLFGYLAGLTKKLEFVTGIIILPQRQTVLVAKQATEVDLLSAGQFRLGVGLGWNEVEYQALNENFKNRGKRSEEQIKLLRELFTQQSVTFNGTWHHVDAAGLNPLPVRGNIPIWLGGNSDATFRRVAQLADGWFPQMPPDEARPAIERIRQYARDLGRDPETIGIEGRINLASTPEDQWAPVIQQWRDLGATHLGINTMRAGLASPQQHIDAIRHFKESTEAIGPKA
jgi:probable F420-dependent oxidoreductase